MFVVVLLTCSFLSFLNGLRDRGESNSGIWSGGCDIVCRLLSFLSLRSSARPERKKKTQKQMTDWIDWNGFGDFRWTENLNYHPCYGWSTVYQSSFVQIVVLAERPVFYLFHTLFGRNNGTSNLILGISYLQPFPVSLNGRMCDVQRMLSIIFSQHDDWPIWNQSLIRIVQIHPGEF